MERQRRVSQTARLSATCGGIIAALLIGATFFFWNSSYTTILRRTQQNGEIVWRGNDANGRRFMVTVARDSEVCPAIMLLTSRGVRGWQTSAIGFSDLNGRAVLEWSEPHGFRRFGESWEPNWAFHQVIIGHDAIRFLGVLPHYLPGGITASVRQAEASYIIHLVTYDMDASGLQQIWGLLENAGLIEMPRVASEQNALCGLQSESG